MTVTPSPLVRFLEDRFACALACVECARACAARVSFVALEPAAVTGDPRAASCLEEHLEEQWRPLRGGELRRRALLCVEVCDVTARLLSEDSWRDEHTIRVQVEWCRAVALECAHVCDRTPGPESDLCGDACRACARACTEFLATLSEE
ncbi:ferredoxin [Streptomyces sp. NPDC046821]|uniref:ferredoxin n=1 Tax=Streptomyces sp. NPDC046821 TaxID=3154702 RepID=UPI0033EFA428